ncbi:CinA family protein [uncultured Alcanivorax sp.]|jgi:nicotinamide-nucleotide amidase|uniref:CinA family protein n=1 Tax=uncultured Alcanivorax sp. TaxID=191215 RepID=UPI0025D77C8C|nr:CinA family protein [uncultured Alcanivorax sp.]
MPIRDEEILAAAQALADSLAQQRLLLTTAESCTGGGIAETLTGIAGASAWFDRGFVTYSNEAKLSMLGVLQSTLDRFGAVSEATALEMARGAISHSGAHVSVAVTGIAGPDGGTPDKPVGTVWIAWGQKLGYAEARRFQFDGDRNAVRQQAILEAILGLNARLK